MKEAAIPVITSAIFQYTKNDQIDAFDRPCFIEQFFILCAFIQLQIEFQSGFLTSILASTNDLLLMVSAHNAFAQRHFLVYLILVLYPRNRHYDSENHHYSNEMT